MITGVSPFTGSTLTVMQAHVEQHAAADPGPLRGMSARAGGGGAPHVRKGSSGPLAQHRSSEGGAWRDAARGGRSATG